MVGKAKSHTKADKRRFQLLQQVGCIPCRMMNLGLQEGDIHHILKSGKRQSHQETIVLCKWHHVGYEPGVPDKICQDHKGPSLAREKKRFYEVFGTEDELLKATDKALEMIEESFVK